MDVDSDRNPKRKGSPIDEGGRYHPHPTDQINRSHALAQILEKKGLELMNRLKNRGLMSLALEDRFKAHFGASPEICADIWLRLDPSRLPEKPKKSSFFCGLSS
jgi:hypothetical protein